ncbi:DUF4249 domain-containing protein [Flagellimonas zhangzhouensis]|uniref:DUF4249 domain-containing protein n=1 Tax=Flagellimonas zhangzhouensis TaxID=1073328 RepID=A0A1H2QK39_9FLAO|nr:DUF4249 domain-containing protein [Allomuricauda zhangzhouensis]SDQ54232.1 protein of unknown function [Allomuricauda zhangzhouensis]SDW07583.1 protein of unknown function [Allomuricauda zhangzhouensis]
MKLYKYLYKCVFALVLLTCFVACLEELDIDTLGDTSASDLLVVEAVLTDELKTQTVFLSRSDSRLDLETDTIYNPYLTPGATPYDSVTVESAATVKLLGTDGSEVMFTEGEPGKYYSNTPFALAMGTQYQLDITTSSGDGYLSDPIEVVGTAGITDVYAERMINDIGVEGVAIYVDSEPLSGDSQYYRFAYDETYKIEAPLWNPYDFKLTNYDNTTSPPTYNLEIVEREVQNKICYNTVSSNSINVLSVAGNSSANINRHLVRFISRENFIIAQRYSILVKQFVESQDANSYFEILKDFSQSESLFSQVQTGPIYSNVYRKDGAEESVLGYVEAVGATEQRLFFNYEDFFPDEEKPSYAFDYDCGFETALLYNPEPPPACPQGLLDRIEANIVTYYSEYEESLVPDASCPGPYVFVPKLCGDCTLLGANVVPDFWEE